MRFLAPDHICQSTDVNVHSVISVDRVHSDREWSCFKDRNQPRISTLSEIVFLAAVLQYDMTLKCMIAYAQN